MAIVILVFSGCKDTKAYNDFVYKYGASSRYYCSDEGFLTQEYIHSDRTAVSRQLMTNDANVPIRCNVKDISIRVKETVATGAMSGSVQ